ncbi:hypothetical protein [Paraconexibacter sp.]|uniref:hypothetical protein n=1 Tax=Paraconexibacter sp. TaxID=2949640 RepID=UPI003562FFAD
MITQPSTPRLLAVIREQLNAIAPTLTDPAAAAGIGMLDRVLLTLEVRAEHEIAWMVEAVDEITSTAKDVIPELAEPQAAQAALDALETGRTGSLHLSDVTAEFNLAGRLLSELLEATAATTGASRDRVMGLLEHRLANEMAVQGADFALVGRD